MSDSVVSSPTLGPATQSRRGQSLVEFALVLPMLLVLLLGIDDFGRAFSAGIILEAAARNAAEAAAQEYLQVARNGPAINAAAYQRIHDVALMEVCREAERLPGELDADSDGVCEMPRAAVCVHDLPADPDDVTPPSGDPLCGTEASGAPQPGCSAFVDDPADPSDQRDAWSNLKGTDPSAPEALAYVEVRVCYQFTILINLQLPFGWGLSFDYIWLQRDRSFAVADY